MINLSTPSEELLREIYDEKPKARYWHEKQTGSKSKLNELRKRYREHADELGKKFIGYQTEWKSQHGNRWYIYDIVNVSDKAFHIVTVSFIYYETYGSIGCFMPTMSGASIFTSHFFLRYCERMHIPFRSRQMIEEFAQNIISMTSIGELDKDGEEQEVFRIPHQGVIKARRRKDNPQVVEMRTFLSDTMLSNSKTKEYAEMVERADSLWHKAGSLIVRFIKEFINEKLEDMEINKELMGAKYNEHQAWQMMEFLVNEVSDYPETEIKTILKGMTLAMAAMTSAYEKVNNITDNSLRSEVAQWLADKDFGIGQKDKSPADGK